MAQETQVTALSRVEDATNKTLSTLVEDRTETTTLKAAEPGPTPANPPDSPAQPPGKAQDRVILSRFSITSEEDLFQLYIRSHKINLLPAFVFVAVLYQGSTIALDVVFYGVQQRLVRVIVYSVFVALTLVTLVVLKFKDGLGKRVTSAAIFLLWMLVIVSLLLDTATSTLALSLSGAVGWVQVVVFTTFVVIPWRLRWALAFSLVLSAAYCVETLVLWLAVHRGQQKHDVIVKELFANSFLFLGAILLGVFVFVFSDDKQRRSFIESKKTNMTSYQIEKEYREQERLLLSVLPKHVADEMVQDLEAEFGGQFRKIYMSRHENVSILFADIVGFTAISSSVTAAELVKILNQLFASFDNLGNKYHQQRIKILGDCYYCVCGALDQRPDHAVLSIHMGMSMVEAIRDVVERTGKDVKMRVGIHTGSVLGGVLGQRQWQFDVLGKEVTLANHMESGGLPARVHISQATKELLNGEFELEPGNGMERDEYLRLHNVVSYLVRAIIKPYPQGTLDKDRDPAEGKERKNTDPDVPDQSSSRAEEGSENQKLQKALLDRTRNTGGNKQMNPVILWFRDRGLERSYRQRREPFSGFSMGALCLVLLLGTAATMIMQHRTLITIVTFVVAEILLFMMALVSAASPLQTKLRLARHLMRFGQAVEKSVVTRMLWEVTAIVILVLADVAIIIQCDTDQAEEMLSNSTLLSQPPGVVLCPYPAYFVYQAYLILLGVSALIQMEVILKFFVVVLVTALYSVLYAVFFSSIFDLQDASLIVNKNERIAESKYELTIYFISASVALLGVNRKMEEVSRRLFLWKEESERQTKHASELRRKNEALVYNILPPHVARDFIGQQKGCMELYSQAYDEAAVMFAACPNFHDFYSESAVNKEGLECLRFLNEIISDYDELLWRPEFKSVTKIKTVGPTYMAASGINTERVHKTKSIRKRWKHLDDLVQFALEMKKELANINEQSFNNFILRIGINHGPIIAGVIGARKPHYDIWGNTVNVASRMESTGMADKIQVVKETKLILEEFGYFFRKRGMVKVKGKGELMTYFLEGRNPDFVVRSRSRSKQSLGEDHSTSTLQEGGRAHWNGSSQFDKKSETLSLHKERTGLSAVTQMSDTSAPNSSDAAKGADVSKPNGNAQAVKARPLATPGVFNGETAGRSDDNKSVQRTAGPVEPAKQKAAPLLTGSPGKPAVQAPRHTHHQTGTILAMFTRSVSQLESTQSGSSTSSE